MTERKVNVFFYGLFMDMGVLQQRGLAPSNPQVARLDGYDIEIRDRATLILNAAETVYGMVTGLTHEEIDALYAEPSVRDYRPEAVMVTLEDARQVPAWCYNLPQVTDARRNTAYALRLLEVAKMLAFPGAYLEKLQRLAQ
jgi:Gamma-glutamyl cyclotransferase, AIG2-like